MHRLAAALIVALILTGRAPAQTPGPPKLDIAGACREAGTQYDAARRADAVKACVASETKARKELEEKWSRFNPTVRSECVGTANVGGSVKPTYSELISCIEMKTR
jgi:hypothetical protein